MAYVQNLTRLVGKLQARAAKYKGDNVSVLVGYTAAYAIYVHEAVGMTLAGLPRRNGKGRYWDPQGRAQAKFLEEPARNLQPELAQIVGTALAKGKTMAQALLLAGLRLQRASMQLCPVDTGNLRASAFTRLEN